MKKILFISICLLLCFLVNNSTNQQNYQEKINWLYQRLQNKFWRNDKPFKSPWNAAQMKGLYQSHIHVNFVDKKNTYFSTLMRRDPLDDNNMFVTSFVLYCLLQNKQLGTINLNQSDFSMALEAIAGFRDKNTQYGLPQYNFWPQNLVDGIWVAQPSNLLNIANMVPSNLPKPVMNIIQRLGLDIIFALKGLSKVFIIPADNDDSSVNLALLGFLKEVDSPHFNFWKSYNFKIQAFYKKLLKYAYRPFEGNYSENKFANQIDPRTYYLYHQFFQNKKISLKAKGLNPSLILPTTWLLNFQQQIEGAMKMPFSNNNVDATVCANVIFGISSLVLNDQLKLQNLPQLKQLLSDTAQLIAYVIEEKISLRPELALVYYPSKYDFFWFVSRVINLFKRYPSLPQPLDYVNKTLTSIMKSKGTDFLIQSSEEVKSNEITWSQFLGNFGQKNRNQDQIFSTALALNALIDTWTYRNKNQIHFDSQTPSEVYQTIKSGVNFLQQNIKNKMKEYNAFFSGSWKSDETDPYIYPANIHRDKNGREINPNNSTFNDITMGMNYVMEGYIQKDQYKKMLEEKWFNQTVPDKFNGFNQGPFPFWSAQPITEVIALSVFSKFMKLQANLDISNQFV